jgi:type I restriction enzyme S subunit
MRDNWQFKKISDLGNVTSGGTPPTNITEYWNGDIVWVTPADLSKIKFYNLTSSDKKITSIGLQNSSANLIPKGSIIMSSRAPIGYFAIPNIEFSTNQGCKSITLNKNQNNLFHYYNLIFNVEVFKRRGEGTTFAEISKKEIEQLKFLTPPLPQQRKIAKILTTCDTVIEKTEAAIAKYQSIKKGVMHDLFTRGIDLTTGKLRPKYEDAPELYKESELGMIPKEWEVKRLEEVGSIITGNTPSTTNKSYYNGHVMFISPFDIGTGKYIKSTEKKITTEGLAVSRKIPIDSICVVCIGSTIGKIGLTTEECCTNQQINSVSPYQIELSDFFYYASLKFLIHQLYIEAGLQAVPIVNKTVFEKLLLFSPQKMEALTIGKRLNVIDKKLETEQSTLSKYRQLKTGLMQHLLTGQVEVMVEKELNEIL